PLTACVAETVRVVLQSLHDDVDHVAAVLIALNHAANRHQPRAHHDLALFLEHGGPDDEVGDSSLILDGHEDHALGAAGPLPDQHQPGDCDALPVAHLLEPVGRDEAAAGIMLAKEAHR